MATHIVRDMGYPMPPLRKGPSEPGRRLPGGMPPTPNRTTTSRWVNGSRTASEPFSSRAIRVELAIDRRWQA